MQDENGQNIPGWAVDENSSIDDATFDNQLQNNLNNDRTDGGNIGTVTGSHCWDLRKSFAKRIVFCKRDTFIF